MSEAQMHVIASPIPDQAIPDQTVTAFSFARLAEMPDAIAFIDGASGREFSYRGMHDTIHRLAGGLKVLGVGPGACVALMAPNCPEFALVFHAVAVAGGTVTTINPAYGEGEMRHQLNDAGARWLITVPAFIDTANGAIDGTSVDEIISIGDQQSHRCLDDVYGEPIEQVPVDLDEAVVVLPYSSGTTGLPKGVMLTHRNLVANLVQSNTTFDYGIGGSALAVLPFFHIYGMQLLMNSLLAVGKTIITMPRFDMEQALSLIQEHKVDHFYIVPPVALGLARHPLVDQYDISSLQRIICAAAPLGSALSEEASARIGCRIAQGYGMTELSPVSHMCSPDHYKPGSSGVTAPNTLCRVVDATGHDVGVDAEGELWVKGPQVMKGYHANVEATMATLDQEGWLHTGDIVRIDADGYLFVVDRVKELIKFKGFQVAPAELEDLLLSHPAVTDVAVIGIPDEQAGELPKAFVVLKEEGAADADALMAFVAGKVAAYKRIREVAFIESIPKSPSGKILRRLLRDQPT